MYLTIAWVPFKFQNNTLWGSISPQFILALVLKFLFCFVFFQQFINKYSYRILPTFAEIYT